MRYEPIMETILDVSALRNQIITSLRYARARGKRECKSQSVNRKQINFRLLEDTTAALHFIQASTMCRLGRVG